jgi:quinol monooxygenase YgiN
MAYAPGTDMARVREGISRLIEHNHANEPNTLAYYWTQAESNPESFIVFEQFASREYCQGPHMSGALFQKIIMNEPALISTHPTYVSRFDGFLSLTRYTGDEGH